MASIQTDSCDEVKGNRGVGETEGVGLFRLTEEKEEEVMPTRGCVFFFSPDV